MKTKKIITKNTGYIISNPEHSKVNHNIQLLRITVTNTETKFDFGYQTTSYYVKGGWIKISPQTFIRPKGSNKTFILTNATNIPYGPEKLHFNSSIEWRYFSLHFPKLPEGIEVIDLIEKDPGTSDDFNFFGIKLNDLVKKSLIF
jgi:hypothetical protein